MLRDSEQTEIIMQLLKGLHQLQSSVRPWTVCDAFRVIILEMGVDIIADRL